MSRFVTHSLAACAAIILAATSIGTIISVPASASSSVAPSTSIELA